MRIRAAPRLLTSSIFSSGVELVAPLQNFAHLIGGDGVQPAAEGVELDELQIRPGRATNSAALYSREW